MSMVSGCRMIGVRKARREMVGQQPEQLALRGFGAWFGDEDFRKARLDQTLLFVEIGAEIGIDVDPLGDVQRFQPDLERACGAVIGCVAGRGHRP